MQTTDKEQIAHELRVKMSGENLSQADVQRLSGLSKTNISFIASDKWHDKVISDDQWLKLAQWMGLANDWNTVETPGFVRIHKMCMDAQQNHIMLGISAKQGSGKSHALKAFAYKNPRNTFYIQCHEHWSKKDFLAELKKVMGLDLFPQSITQQVNDIVDHLLKLENPLLIVDEADELKDGVLRFIKTFYNETHDKVHQGQCGFIICGGNHLKKRIEKGVRLCKQSYQEIYSRLGNSFKPLREIDAATIAEICTANGVTDQQDIKEIVNSTLADQDLRAVQRKIHAAKLRNSKLKKLA